MRKILLATFALLALTRGATAQTNAFPVVDTGQTTCYDATAVIPCPAAGQSFFGQDAQFNGTQPSYSKSSDGLTVKDNVTGLTWQQGHYTGQVYWAEAKAVATAMNAANYGGYSDWRLPTITELYSLWNGNTGWPFVDTSHFTVNYGSQDELSHAIFWGSNKYSGLLESAPDVGAELAFGVNFGTGHIKAYSIASGPRHLIRCVRGASYGVNAFLDHGDGTITDQATGLMWAQTDSGSGMEWEHALAYAQTRNAARFLGHSDWRLPSSKELQSLVDYTRSPGATDPAHIGPAIDPLFKCSGITNEAGVADYPWYWTSTTNPGLPGATTYDTAWYVAFGRAVGSDGKDLHGAGAVRFDMKVAGTPGGESRYYNYVRLVRNAAGASSPSTVTRFLPIVLDATGRARYTSELFLANRGTTEASVTLLYTAAAAFGGQGSGTVTVSLPAGHQLVLDDAIGYLRSKGLAIPATGNQGGSLRVTFDRLSSDAAAHAGVRITSPSENGRAGVSYVAPRLEELPTTATSWLHGLRSSSQDRTNVAFANASTSSSITLRLTLVNGEGTSQKHVFDDVTLGPGQWKQIDDVFVGTGLSQGYASVSVVPDGAGASGTGPYFAYAVFNDEVTNDGSFVPFEAASAPAEACLLPVVVETGPYTSELVLTNRSSQAQTVELSYVESLSPEAGAGGMAVETLAAGEQKLFSSILETLRGKVATIGPKGGTYAGTLTARFLAGGSAAQGYAGARTGSPARTGAGRYGLFYRGIGASSRAQASAWVHGLRQDATVRANVAVAASPENGAAIRVHAEVYNGETGALAGTTAEVSLSPGGWTQWANLLPAYGVTQGYVRVVNETPSASFAAYGVVNDGASPGSAAGTDDGSYVPGVQ